MAGYPRIDWTDEHRAKLRDLASRGHSRPEIAKLMGIGLPWLTWKVTQDEPTRIAWREGFDLHRNGGPISPDLKALADAAAKARHRRLERMATAQRGA